MGVHWEKHVSYQLLDILKESKLFSEQLRWLNASDPIKGRNRMYASWGIFKGNESGGCGDGWTIICKSNQAQTPWRWSTKIGRGMMAFRPAEFVASYFRNLGEFSMNYKYNPYLEKFAHVNSSTWPYFSYVVIPDLVLDYDRYGVEK